MHQLSPHHRLTTYTKVILIGLLLMLGIISAMYIWLHRETLFSTQTAAHNQTHLLQSGWDHLAGATPQPDGLHITNTDRPIVQQDGSLGMESSTVNLYGTHLYADDDYTLTATIGDKNKSAVLRFYSAVPLTQDEFYTMPKYIEFILSDKTIVMNTWNSNRERNPYTQKPAMSISQTITSSPNHTLVLKRLNGQLITQIDGHQLSKKRYRDTFGQEVWFGLSTKESNSSWTLQSLDLTTDTPNRTYAVNTESMTTSPVATNDALQKLASIKRSDFRIGTAAALAPSVSDNQYRSFVYGGHFGSITTENTLKWQFVHPNPATYDFTDADTLVNLARQHGLTIHGHTLVFGEANPAWVQNLPTATVNDRSNVKQTMVDHITTVVDHFKGRVTSWDVVNEPLSDDDDAVHLREHKWYDAMSESYITTAFQAAHQADPQAKLFINDFGLEADGERWDTMLALVSKLKASGVPIDGVGFQAHVYEAADVIDPAVLRQHIRQLANIGLSARISEMDVYSDDGPDIQAAQYRDVFAACFAEPNCISWTTWGVSDRYNLYLDDNGRIASGQDYLWDQNNQPTAGLSDIQQLLRQ